MSEFSQAIWGAKYAGLHIIQNPNKTFSFVGSVPASLSYYRKDGQPLTDQNIKEIHQFGAGLLRGEIGPRVWPTREDAIAEANSIGLEVL